MRYILSPFCHAHIEITEDATTSEFSRHVAACPDCDESFYFDRPEVIEETQPESIV